MSEVNKAIVREWVATYNSGDWDDLVDYCTSDYRHHNRDQVLGPDGLAAAGQWLRERLDGFRIEVDDLVAEGDKVVVRFTGHGRHMGSVFGEEPTGAEVVVLGVNVYRFEDHVIAEEWEYVDLDYPRSQLVPSPVAS